MKFVKHIHAIKEFLNVNQPHGLSSSTILRTKFLVFSRTTSVALRKTKIKKSLACYFLCPTILYCDHCSYWPSILKTTQSELFMPHMVCSASLYLLCFVAAPVELQIYAICSSKTVACVLSTVHCCFVLQKPFVTVELNYFFKII